MHRESFPVNSVFCAQLRKFSPSKVLPYTVVIWAQLTLTGTEYCTNYGITQVPYLFIHSTQY